MSVTDSLKAKLATAVTAATLIVSPGSFAADESADANLALNNKTAITQQDNAAEKPHDHLTLPEDRFRRVKVPIFSSRPGSDGISQVPIELDFYHAAMHGNLTAKPSEMVLTVIKGGNDAANRRYERAVAQMASNVSGAYQDDNAVVTAVVGVYAGPDNKRGDGVDGSPSGAIGLYVNDHAPYYFYPESFTQDDMIENIRMAQTYLIFAIETGEYLMDAEQVKEARASRKSEKEGLATSASEAGEAGSPTSGGGEQSSNTPMASLNM